MTKKIELIIRSVNVWNNLRTCCDYSPKKHKTSSDFKSKREKPINLTLSVLIRIDDSRDPNLAR